MINANQGDNKSQKVYWRMKWLLGSPRAKDMNVQLHERRDLCQKVKKLVQERMDLLEVAGEGESYERIYIYVRQDGVL